MTSQKNELVEITIEKKPHCQVEMTVTVFSPLIQKARKEAIQEINKEITVPGFRKGKAPIETITKKYPDRIERRTKEITANYCLQEALKLVKLRVLQRKTPINYNLKSFDLEKGVFTFYFEVEPDIPPIQPEHCPISEVKEEIIDKTQVEETIRQLLLFYAKWIPVTDRGVQENDYVILDLETVEEPKEKIFSGTRFEVKDASMAAWMKKLLLGAKPGEVLEGVSEPDTNATEDQKNLSPKKVRLTLKKIETVEMPKLEETFLKQIGVSTEEELRQRIQELLQSKAKQKQETELRDQVNKYFLNLPFELPLSLIEEEREYRHKQYMQNPSQANTFQKMTTEQKEQLEKGFQEQAEQAVRLFYISRKVVQEANLSILHKDIEEEAIRTLQALGPLRIDPNKIPKEVYALALSKIVLMKAQDHILEQKKKALTT